MGHAQNFRSSPHRRRLCRERDDTPSLLRETRRSHQHAGLLPGASRPRSRGWWRSYILINRTMNSMWRSILFLACAAGGYGQSVNVTALTPVLLSPSLATGLTVNTSSVGSIRVSYGGVSGNISMEFLTTQVTVAPCGAVYAADASPSAAQHFRAPSGRNYRGWLLYQNGRRLRVSRGSIVHLHRE